MKVTELLDKHNIVYRTRDIWHNVCCPFCYNDTGFHLGISDKGYATCFRCGWHSIQSVLSTLLNCTYTEAKHIARSLSAGKGDFAVQYPENKFELPSSGPVAGLARDYMYERLCLYYDDDEFDALMKDYDIRYTEYDYPNYMYAGRIIFPNYFNGKAVSFQGRDYLNAQPAKYITAGKQDELVFHKNFLWGIDHVPYDKVIVCEGVMDALTIGKGAVHTHGVKWTPSQAAELMCFDTVYICYDTDSAGLINAKTLAAHICHRTKVKIVRISAKDINSCDITEVEDLRSLLV